MSTSLQLILHLIDIIYESSTQLALNLPEQSNPASLYRITKMPRETPPPTFISTSTSFYIPSIHLSNSNSNSNPFYLLPLPLPLPSAISQYLGKIRTVGRGSFLITSVIFSLLCCYICCYDMNSIVVFLGICYMLQWINTIVVFFRHIYLDYLDYLDSGWCVGGQIVGLR